MMSQLSKMAAKQKTTGRWCFNICRRGTNGYISRHTGKYSMSVETKQDICDKMTKYTGHSVTMITEVMQRLEPKPRCFILNINK